jgi:hypothetical protein
LLFYILVFVLCGASARSAVCPSSTPRSLVHKRLPALARRRDLSYLPGCTVHRVSGMTRQHGLA